jgi:hypothetical protein
VRVGLFVVSGAGQTSPQFAEGRISSMEQYQEMYGHPATRGFWGEIAEGFY